MELKLPLLIYDPNCPMCVRFKQALERLDTGHRVNFVPLDHPLLFTHYPELSSEACQAKVHYLREDRQILVGGEVITELVKQLPGAAKLAWLLDTDVAKKTADFFYQQVESVRQKIRSEEESCPTCRK